MIKGKQIKKAKLTSLLQSTNKPYIFLLISIYLFHTFIHFHFHPLIYPPHMPTSHSDLIKIQPFIQTLRPSLHQHKNSLDDHLLDHTTTSFTYHQHDQQLLNFNPKDKSLSKSNIMRVVRKTSLANNHKKHTLKSTPECIYSHNQLQVNFHQICTSNPLTQSLKGLHNTKHIHPFLDLRDLKISLIFSKTSPQIFQQTKTFFNQQKSQKLSKSSNLKVKLQITCFELSIQDQFKVKRIFDINLTETLNNKQFLKIQFSDGLKPQSLILNNKIIIPKQQTILPQRNNDKIDIIKPWELANQRKSLLKDKILSQRPKSKIKWSFSLTESCDGLDKSDSQLEKFQEIQQNYGLKASQESMLKFSLELKNRSQLTLNMPKQNPYMNVFQSNSRDQISSLSMKSTFDSDDRSAKQSRFVGLNDIKRVNNIVGSLNFKSKKPVIKQNPDFEQQKTLRPKSSFRSLKEKNDYFMMKESERKKSIKKNIGSQTEGKDEIMEIKSSEVKQEYGIF